MKFKDWLWLIWGLVFPLLGLLYFNSAGLAAGFALFILYAWVIYLGTKSKKDLESGAEKVAGKLESYTRRLERATEAVKEDTKKRKGTKGEKNN